MDASTLIDQFKQGYRTSEFWLVLAAVFFNGATYSLDPGRPFREQVPGLVFAGLAAVYSLTRTGLKQSRSTSLAAAVAAPAAPRAAVATGRPAPAVNGGDAGRADGPPPEMVRAVVAAMLDAGLVTAPRRPRPGARGFPAPPRARHRAGSPAREGVLRTPPPGA